MYKKHAELFFHVLSCDFYLFIKIITQRIKLNMTLKCLTYHYEKIRNLYAFKFLQLIKNWISFLWKNSLEHGTIWTQLFVLELQCFQKIKQTFDNKRTLTIQLFNNKVTQNMCSLFKSLSNKGIKHLFTFLYK
jgi:hypothetical protein